MNLQESLNKLFSLHQFGIKLGLEKINHLLAHLGNPHKNLDCIHIAGSNAKGSVASFINSILLEDGRKVGLYTSPHFIKFNERIRVNGVEIEDEFVVEFMNNLEDYIDQYEPTFFELTTAMAFLYFSENKVDYAVIETGLGGRLDATNVIEPLVSVITTISLEHTNILGERLEQIAYEKGEIIKENSKAVIGLIPPEAEDVLIKKCGSTGTQYVPLAGCISRNQNSLQLQYNNTGYNFYDTPLKGYHQLENSALAVLTVLTTVELNNEFSLFRGIKNVVINSGIQGRYEVYHKSPMIILDSSHNVEGMQTFMKEFKKESEKYSRRTIIFGVMKDKNIKEMLELFDNNFDEIYSTTFNYERAASLEQIETIANKLGIKINPLLEPDKFIDKFKLRNKNECLVVLGSIYLLGDIKAKLADKST